MQLAWDERKSRSNLAKHHVSFAFAARVFDDPRVMSLPDDHASEERWLSIGLVNGVLILVVVHTLEEQGHEEIIRIISARKATPRERKAYEDQPAEK